MQYGTHLPLIELDGRPRTLSDLCAYARRAAALDFRYLCANDHLLFARPWLDGPTVLAAALEAARDAQVGLHVDTVASEFQPDREQRAEGIVAAGAWVEGVEE